MLNDPPLQFVGLYLSPDRRRARTCTLAAAILAADGRLLHTATAPPATVEGRSLPDPAWILNVLEGLVGPCEVTWRPSIAACLVQPQGVKRDSNAAAASASAGTAVRMTRHPVVRVTRRDLDAFAQAGGRRGERQVSDAVAQAWRSRWGARAFPGVDEAWAALTAELHRERAQERLAS